MDLAELREVLTTSGITITPDGGNLRVSPKDRLTDDLRDLIRAHKVELIRQGRLDALRPAFDLVVAAFQAPADEIALAWSIALRDLDAAEATFHADAAMIRAGWRPLEEQAAAFLRREGGAGRCGSMPRENP